MSPAMNLPRDFCKISNVRTTGRLLHNTTATDLRQKEPLAILFAGS